MTPWVTYRPMAEIGRGTNTDKQFHLWNYKHLQFKNFFSYIFMNNASILYVYMCGLLLFPNTSKKRKINNSVGFMFHRYVRNTDEKSKRGKTKIDIRRLQKCAFGWIRNRCCLYLLLKEYVSKPICAMEFSQISPHTLMWINLKTCF